MSLEVSFTKAQLKAKCEQLGITPKSSNNYKDDSKDYYAYALREHYIAEEYPDGNMPKSMEIMLSMETLMVCARFKDLKQDLQDKIKTSNRWFYEEKGDGVRLMNFFLKSEPYSAYSRNLSDRNLLPLEYGGNIYTEVDLSKLEHEFVLDSEIVCIDPNINTMIGNHGCITETQLQAVTALLSMNTEDSLRIQEEHNAPLKICPFDCIFYDGVDLRDKPLLERRKYLKMALAELQSIGFKAEMLRSNMSNKDQFYKMIISEGGEGCIAKDIDAPYVAKSTRSHRHWVKIKRSMSESLSEEGAGDTIDAWISGFEEASKDKQWAGYVGALQLSCYVEDEFGNKGVHHIATISSISMELRKEITEWDEEGNPRLKIEFYNKICEIDGQCVSARAKRLRHAVLVRFRPDKCPDQCVITESFLNSMIL